MILPSISIRQPWAWLVARGFKTFENRSQVSIGKVGAFWVHAAKQPADNFERLCFSISEEFGITIPKELAYGAIVGQGRVLRAVYATDPLVNAWRSRSSSGYLLDGKAARLIKPYPWSGRLGWFYANVPDPHFLDENRMVANIPPIEPKKPLWS